MFRGDSGFEVRDEAQKGRIEPMKYSPRQIQVSTRGRFWGRLLEEKLRALIINTALFRREVHAWQATSKLFFGLHSLAALTPWARFLEGINAQ
jgi:hypothetical protein